MSVNVSHTDFTDATTLFADLAAANAMLDNLVVPDATTSTDGVVKKCVYVANPSGNSATNNQTAIIAILNTMKDKGLMASS
tara:strand:+ start:345 stop:587 length:243 start_codon:yes stop_codon:yes gene_type:complete